MKDTKEQILQVSLRLFAQNGYEAVSVSQISGELGITKGALYRHYASKRAIFESILARMEAQDREQAENHDVPPDALEVSPEAYQETTVAQMVEFSKAMFRYWVQDEFASNFRKLLTLEQHRNPEMMALYQQYLAGGPMGYVADLFAAQGYQHPQDLALRLYGPMFLLYTLYDGADDPDAVLAQFDTYLDAFLQSLEELT